VITWYNILCSGREWLVDSVLLQQMTQLTALELGFASPEALQHLGTLTKLQKVSIRAAQQGWPTAGLQELTALTRLQLCDMGDPLANVSQLTALQQLELAAATTTALNQLQVLPGLTLLCVRQVRGLSLESAPLQLPELQHLELYGRATVMPTSFLKSCTQLRVLSANNFCLQGPGSLAVSTMLQHLGLELCTITDRCADPASWQQVFTGPGKLPHLTSMQLLYNSPSMHLVDVEHMVNCCSNLQRLNLRYAADSCGCALARLPGLTSLDLSFSNELHNGSLVQLTGLKELQTGFFWVPSDARVRALTVLKQLTSLGFVTNGDLKYNSSR